MLSPNVGCMHT